MDAVLLVPPLRERLRTLVVDEEGRGSAVTIPAPGDLPLRDTETDAVHVPVLVVGDGAAGFLGVVRFGLEDEPAFSWIAGQDDPWLAYTTLSALDPYNLVFHFFGCEAAMCVQLDLQEYVTKAFGLVLLGDEATESIAPLLRKRGSTPPVAVLRQPSDGAPPQWLLILGRAPALVAEHTDQNVEAALNAVAGELLADPDALAAVSATSSGPGR